MEGSEKKKPGLSASIQNLSIISDYSWSKFCKEMCMLYTSVLPWQLTLVKTFLSLFQLNMQWVLHACEESPASPRSLFKIKIKNYWKLNQILRNLDA